MRQKTDIEMQRAAILKIQRTAIRLKHSLNADEELNRVLPATLREFDNALQAGELKEIPLDFSSLLGDDSVNN